MVGKLKIGSNALGGFVDWTQNIAHWRVSREEHLMLGTVKVRLVRLTAVLIAVAGLVASGLVWGVSAHASHISPGDGDGEQFVWPVSSWISGTDYYPNGNHHSGSADLTAPHYTLIRPARPGTVVRASFGSNNYRVGIRHEGANGQRYYSTYVHLAEPPLVQVGDEVDFDTPLGYVGRTGSAYWAGPHIHFSIRKDTIGGPLLKIPDLEVGDWVNAGDFIPGDYEGLSSVQAPDWTFDVRVTVDPLRVYPTTGRQIGSQIAELSPGDVVTVVDSRNGQYRIELPGGQLGWIAHSGTDPVDSEVFGVEVQGTSPRNVRRAPTTSSDIIGAHDPTRGTADRYLPAFGRSGGWRLVLWRCNVTSNRSDDPDDQFRSLGGCPHRTSGQSSLWKYGWMGSAVVNDTDEFHTRTRVDNLTIHGNQVIDGQNWPNSSVTLGQYGASRALVHVLEIRNGWYRVDYNGQIGWTRGWFTGGRH
jgi:murein DD-endopeptidase MepM/ murein hydrolase activator NlpD